MSRPSPETAPAALADEDELRATQALAQAGDRLVAARQLERHGHFDAARALRIELARALHDPLERLSVLRGGRPLSSPRTRAARALCSMLSEELERAVMLETDPAGRARLLLEAAHAAADAGDDARAARHYEALQMFDRALAHATQAGDLPRLERLHELRDARRRDQHARDQALADAAALWRLGQRHAAHLLLREQPTSETTSVAAPRFAALPSGSLRVQVRCPAALRTPWTLVVHPGPELRVGRGPSCGLQLAHPSLSREHARLLLRDDTPWLFDLGSRGGTFATTPLVPSPPPGPDDWADWRDRHGLEPVQDQGCALPRRGRVHLALGRAPVIEVVSQPGMVAVYPPPPADPASVHASAPPAPAVHVLGRVRLETAIAVMRALEAPTARDLEADAADSDLTRGAGTWIVPVALHPQQRPDVSLDAGAAPHPVWTVRLGAGAALNATALSEGARVELALADELRWGDALRLEVLP